MEKKKHIPFSILAPLFVVFLYLLICGLTSLGLIASHWNQPTFTPFHPAQASLELLFGADILGRSVVLKIAKSIQGCIAIGVLSSLFCTSLGLLIGITAGACLHKNTPLFLQIDRFFNWLIHSINAIPSIVLIIAITFVLGKGFLALLIAINIGGWTSLAKMLRTQTQLNLNLEYQLAAKALGVSPVRRIIVHLLPSLLPTILPGMLLSFINAVKMEVIISYLGLGLQNTPSLGLMIDDARFEFSRGIFWQGLSATLTLALLLFCVQVVFNHLTGSQGSNESREKAS
jgi:peptide/nickel transport system permease protein